MLTARPIETAAEEEGKRPAKVDDTDLAILEALHHNASLTDQDLARLTGITRSAATRRRNRLIKDGAIRGMHARLDPRVIQLSIVTYVLVKLGDLHSNPLEQFEERMAAHANVVEWSRIIGDWDILLKIVTATNDDFNTFHRQLLAESKPERIQSIQLAGPTNGKGLPIKVPEFKGKRQLTPDMKRIRLPGRRIKKGPAAKRP